MKYCKHLTQFFNVAIVTVDNDSKICTIKLCPKKVTKRDLKAV